MVLPLILFSGHIANTDEIVSWLRWLQYISPMRYIMEITLKEEYRRENFNDNDHMNPYPVDGYNYDLGMGLCYGMMAILAAGIRIIGFFCLKWQAHNT